MARRDLLPGVTTDACPPPVIFDSAQAIVRARRRAALLDAAQFIMIAGVDWLFVRWPYARVPFAGRTDSVLILGALHVLLIAHVILARAFPRWSARRIATTWCLSERARFFAQFRRDQAR